MVLLTELLECLRILELLQIYILQLIAMNTTNNEDGINACAVGTCRPYIVKMSPQGRR